MVIKKKITDFRFKKKKRPGGWADRQKKETKPEKNRLLFLLTSAAVGLSVGVVVFSIYKWLAVSDFFQITAVKVEGVHRLDRQQIMELSGVTMRTNLLALDAAGAKNKIESHDWVKEADLKRDLPSVLTIRIQERVPVALVNTVKGLSFADKNGVVFAKADPPEDLDYPVITGLEKVMDASIDKMDDGLRERRDSLKKALQFIQYAGRGSSSLPRQNISEIFVTEKDEYILFLADRPFPIYIGTEVSSERYYRLAKVLYWLYKKREFSDVNFIRMDYMNSKVLVGKTDAS